MGRPSTFDREKALKKATILFWKHGYANTSVSQLLKAAGIGEGSFYNAFGSKKALFLECIDYYNRTFMRRRSESLNAAKCSKDRIADFFDTVVDDMRKNPAPGCLVSNSLEHSLLGDKKIKGNLFAGFDGFLRCLTALIEEGQESGELSTKIDARSTARLLFTYLHGLNRLSVYRADERNRKGETSMLLEAILPTP